VTNFGDDTVSAIDTSTNTVTAGVPVGDGPVGVSVTPDGRFVYVANYSSNDVSVIRTSTNTVIATVPVGGDPLAFGIFIQGMLPPPPPSNVPTLSEWGLISMAGILGIVGFMVMRRRKVSV